MSGTIFVARSISTTSSKEAARTRDSPKFSAAHRMIELAAAVSNSSLTSASSSAVHSWSLTLVSVTDLTFPMGPIWGDRGSGGPSPAA